VDISVRELKNHLSEYLRRLQAGEEITVTSHGRPLGRLRLVRDSAAGSEEQAVARLRELPLVRAGRGGRVQGARCPLRWPEDETPLSQRILDERE